MRKQFRITCDRSRALPEDSEERAHPPRRVGRRVLALGRRRLPPAPSAARSFSAAPRRGAGERRRGGDERLQRRLARRRRRRWRRRGAGAAAGSAASAAGAGPPGGEPCAWSWRREGGRKRAPPQQASAASATAPPRSRRRRAARAPPPRSPPTTSRAPRARRALAHGGVARRRLGRSGEERGGHAERERRLELRVVLQVGGGRARPPGAAAAAARRSGSRAAPARRQSWRGRSRCRGPRRSTRASSARRGVVAAVGRERRLELREARPHRRDNRLAEDHVHDLAVDLAGRFPPAAARRCSSAGSLCAMPHCSSSFSEPPGPPLPAMPMRAGRAVVDGSPARYSWSWRSAAQSPLSGAGPSRRRVRSCPAFACGLWRREGGLWWRREGVGAELASFVSTCLCRCEMRGRERSQRGRFTNSFNHSQHTFTH